MAGSGPLGIVPTRGQVVALRANMSFPFGTGREGFVANGGLEYWFPRPKVENSDQNELVIFGGGREAADGGRFEFFETDDSRVNHKVGECIRHFLPSVFPGKFEEEKDPDMEWVGFMLFLCDSRGRS